MRGPSSSETGERQLMVTDLKQPMPLIVGVSRSGTTLLRMMLDAHSELAIPSETHMLHELAQTRGHERGFFDDCVRGVTEYLFGSMKHQRAASSFLGILKSSPAWKDMNLCDEKIRQSVSEMKPFDKSEAIRGLYRIYAQRQGKKRWGDKTPDYLGHMRSIARMLPESHFIHIIRDGRDVALSGRDLWFSPGRNIKKQANHWVKSIRLAREQAQDLDHYLEVHYEDLVLRPEITLRRICAYIDLRFEAGMLSYHERAADRLSEINERLDSSGEVIATAETRREIHSQVLSAPNPSRIGRWRSELGSEEILEYEAIAGGMLRQLGYEAGA